MATSEDFNSHNDVKKHYAWRNTVADALPSIAARVFNLRGVAYFGSGQRYDLERNLGRIIVMANDYNKPISKSELMLDEIDCELFLERLAKAEWSAANHGANPEAEGSPWHTAPAKNLQPTA
jgi:hypothetical protein